MINSHAKATLIVFGFCIGWLNNSQRQHFHKFSIKVLVNTALHEELWPMFAQTLQHLRQFLEDADPSTIKKKRNQENILFGVFSAHVNVSLIFRMCQKLASRKLALWIWNYHNRPRNIQSQVRGGSDQERYRLVRACVRAAWLPSGIRFQRRVLIFSLCTFVPVELSLLCEWRIVYKVYEC